MSYLPIFPITYGIVHIRVFTSANANSLRLTSNVGRGFWWEQPTRFGCQYQTSAGAASACTAKSHRQTAARHENCGLAKVYFCYKRSPFLASHQNANTAGVMARFKAARDWYRINVSSFNIKGSPKCPRHHSSETSNANSENA